MKRYEQTIRVLTAFFAVLLGFGLKNLLDAKPRASGGLDEIHTDPAPFFVLSALLFLRFLLGSANHSWHDYVLPDSKDTIPFRLHPTELIRDLIFLVIHGLLGIAICYSITVNHFFKLHLWFTVVGLVWVIIYLCHATYLGRSARRWWIWAIINALHAAIILVAWTWGWPRSWGKFPWPEYLLGQRWDSYLVALVAAYAVILIADVWFQLDNLNKATMPQAPQEPEDEKRAQNALTKELSELTTAIKSLTTQLKVSPSKRELSEPKPAPSDQGKVSE